MEQNPPKRTPKKKPKLAEVINLREPDQYMIEMLEGLLEEAYAGNLHSMNAFIVGAVDGEGIMGNYITLGRIFDPVRALGELEIIKESIMDSITNLGREER